MKVAKRRRREHKTDYGKRIKILKGRIPRIIFRKSNKYVLAQYVSSKQAQDKVEFGVISKDLLKYGWPKESQAGLKSISASYLTGFLIGKKIMSKALENPILDTETTNKQQVVPDFGMQRMLHKTRTYAFLNGLIDAGVKIKYDKKLFPEEDRIKGKHMKAKVPFDEIKSRIEKNA